MNVRSADLHKGSTFIYDNWAWTIIGENPPDLKRGTVKFQAESPVGSVHQFEFYADSMERYISEGDKVK